MARIIGGHRRVIGTMAALPAQLIMRRLNLAGDTSAAAMAGLARPLWRRIAKAMASIHIFYAGAENCIGSARINAYGEKPGAALWRS